MRLQYRQCLLLIVAGAPLIGSWLSVRALADPVPNGSIHGRLVEYPGRQPTRPTKPEAIAGQRITLTDMAGNHTVATTTTASDGAFSFALPPGDYLLISLRSRKVVHVAAGKDVWVNLQQVGE